MLDRIGAVFNTVNGWDLTWVGFRQYKPAPEQDMSARVVAILCLFYCPASAVIAVLIVLLVLRERADLKAFVGMAVGAAAAALLLQSLSAWFWNRRARRLRQASRAP